MVRFKFRTLTEKYNKSRYLLGFYTLGRANKNNDKINSRFLNFLSVAFIIIFLLTMVFSISLFGFIGYYKFIVKEDTLLKKTSNPAILLPSLSTNTLNEVGQEVQAINKGDMEVKDFNKRYILFMPFYFFLPLMFITIVVHEFGHFLMCRRAGVKVKEYGVGALAIFSIPLLPLAYVEPAKKPLAKASKFSFFSIISAGIGFNMLIAAIAFIIFIFLLPFEFIYLLAIINFSIAIFNVLPIAFLDGGQFISKVSKKLNYITSCVFLLVIASLFL